MTNGWALPYADWCTARNDARRIVTSPGRIMLWAVYASALGFFTLSRFTRGHAAHAFAPRAAVNADYAVCALIATLVFSLATGREANGIFRSRAEARLLSVRRLHRRWRFAYLAARESLGQAGRFLFSLLYLIVVLAPYALSAVAALTDVAIVLGVITAWAAMGVPRRLLPAWAGRICACAGMPLGLLAIAPAVRDAVIAIHAPARLADPVLAFVPAWHPGSVLLEPNLLWCAGALALAAAAIGLMAVAGRDAYPELYALSLARIERRENLLRRRASRAGSAKPAPLTRITRASRRPRLWSGVLALVWKSGVEFRAIVHPAASAGAIGLSALAGVTLALSARAGGRDFGLVFVTAINLLIVTGYITPAIGGELRRPLFWLSGATLFERLSALVLAYSWRRLAIVEAAAAGFALAGGSPLHALELACGVPTVVILVTAAGVAAFALFPSPSDQRGPAALLRLVVCGLLLLPPAVAGGIIAALGAPRTALIAASLLALVEAGALVGAAAWRLDGRTDRLPM